MLRRLVSSPKIWKTWKEFSCRNIATQSHYNPSKLRNIALVAHIDSGKTTLTESILLSSSYLFSSGSVDTGSTTTDFLPAERERGITIQSASIPVKWRDWKINIVDTPGHADFGMEVESASRIIDGAVVLIDSVEGVEAQTKGVWRQLDRYKVPSRIMFLNKLDRPGASFRSSLSSLLSNRLHPNPIPLTIPIASFDPTAYSNGEPGIEGLVDLVKWELWKWDLAGNSTRYPLPRNAEELGVTPLFHNSHPILKYLSPARTAFLESIAMFSQDLMEHLLGISSDPSAYLHVEQGIILRHLREIVLRQEILPVICGSAMKNIGTELVMDYVGELLASPVDVPHISQSKNPPVRLLAWKVVWDKRKGWMTFVRVYSGTLTRQGSLLNTTRNQRERVSKLLLLYASEAEEVEELRFGSIGVILGLKHTRTGDTLVAYLGSAPSIADVPDIKIPPSVISASIIPQSHSDLAPVEEALNSLARTDPSVRIDNQEGQILVHGLGALHLEIVEGRLRDEWKVRFELGRRRVSYHEAPGISIGNTDADGVWSTELAGKQVDVRMTLRVRPLAADEVGDPTWDGNVVICADGRPLPHPGTASNDPLIYISRGIASTLSASPHTSLPLSHLHIEVVQFHFPIEVPSVLTGAAASILRLRVMDAGMGPVMEPYVQLKISVTEESMGKVIKDLAEHGGVVQELDLQCGSTGDDEYGGYPEAGVYLPPAWLSPSALSSSTTFAGSSTQIKRFIYAIAPLSKVLDYSNRLRALSGGHGLFEMSDAGYREVNPARRLEIMAEIGRA